jgi:thioredoxin 1
LKPFLAVGVVLYALGQVSVWSDFSAVSVGMTMEEVRSLAGAPLGRVEGHGGVILVYQEAGVELRNDRVVKIDPKLGRNAMNRRKAARKPEPAATDKFLAWARDAKQSVMAYLGLAASNTTAKNETPPADVPAPAPVRETIRTIATGGKQVDLPSLLVPGKVTVVDFYADWCQPCRRISPKLELLATQDDSVYLSKVDIVRWGTEVTAQYEIDSVPHIRVYDRAGNMVGSPTSDFSKVAQFVAQAK